MGVPIHPTEFRGPEPYLDGLSNPLLGLPPAALAALALLVLGALLIGLAVGRGAARPPASGAAALWKAVDDACQAAMKAHTDALPDKAAVLRQVIEARLGRTLALGGGLGGGLGGPLAALDRALAGQAAPLAEPWRGHDRRPGHPHPGHDAEHGGPGHGDAADDGGPPRPAAVDGGVTIVNNGRVEIRAAGGEKPAPPTLPPPPAPPPPRDLTTAQRADALRRAVSDLNDHWRRKGPRMEELDAAWRELSARPSERRPVWTMR